MDYVDLGNRVRRKRKQLGWTQDMLAAKIGVSTSFIGHIERGSRNASLETLVQIANALEVGTDYLLAASLIFEEKQKEMPVLRAGQRQMMREVLLTLSEHLSAWDEEPDEE